MRHNNHSYAIFKFLTYNQFISMQKRLVFLMAILLVFTTSAMAQITTSGIYGKVTSSGEDAIGATVTATHQPSGTVYRAVTNADGRFTVQGMRVGGPYKVEISYVGHQPKIFNNVSLNLGESQNLSCALEEDARQLQEIVVSGRAGLNGTKTGAAQSINSQRINEIPSVSHSIADIARLNPQVTTNMQSGSISFAGTNNRYNAFQIDGVMNNDVFGLAANGSNGGQAETQPVSMETIDQIQINVAPFDVRQGGFTGGSINAITKSGTNEFHGSAYFNGNNQDLVGHHYKLADGTYANPIEEEEEYLAGFTIGGPIIKNKLFFFANYERSHKTYPTQYGLGAAGSKVEADRATEILDAIKDMASRQGVTYNGAYSNTSRYINSDKMGVKLDWNINDFNKFSLRWSYVTAASLKGLGGIATLNTEDHLYEFKSQTNSFTAELQSRLTPELSNEARVSYQTVRDKRTSGNPFPSVTVYNVSTDGTGTVNIGNEYSSMANNLDQDVFTVEDNLTWLKGNHAFTLGTHNEFYKFSNLFIQNLYGCYYFNNYNDFMSYYASEKAGNPDGELIYNYYYGSANTDVTGDPRWAAEFGAGQLGLYLQDKWDATTNFQLTYGLRMDMPLFFNTPAENVGFNEFAASEGWDLKTNRRLSKTPMWSPRVGFRWDIKNNRRFILRGGAGIFTGRIPFVWLSNSISNTGIQLRSYNAGQSEDLQLILDPNRQQENGDRLSVKSGNQIINVFDKHFKFAQNFRLNLGFDFQALGIDWTAEAIYSKNLNDVYYQNLAYEPIGVTYGQQSGYSWDYRPMFQSVASRNKLGKDFSNIYVLRNTNKGYTYNLSLEGKKHFDFGLDLAASYTFTKSKAISSASSSVAQSNWRNNHSYLNVNEPELANSGFNVPHTVKASAFYHISYGRAKMFTTTVGLIYQGNSGSPYSLYYRGDVNGDGYNGNDLLYLPTDEQIDQMVFTDIVNRNTGIVTKTAAAQKEDFRQWMSNTSYVSSHRGQFYKRFADNLKFENHFDLHLAEKIGIKVGSYVHALEITMDIMNIANLLNKDWGRTYSTGYMSNFYAPIEYVGGGKYQFANSPSEPLQHPSDYYSRWRGQIGVKYTF